MAVGLINKTPSAEYYKAYRENQIRNGRGNMYSLQNPISDSSGMLSSSTDPTSQSDFMKNYREATKRLGSVIKTNNKRTIDSETRNIMNRIKLPTYNDALSDEYAEKYNIAHMINPEAAERSFEEESNKWEEDNFYYKLRAAQVLKKMPSDIREGLLNNFNISAYDAKNQLDKVIEQENNKLANALSSLTKAGVAGANAVNNFVGDTIYRLTGQKKSETTTDENGVTRTTTTTQGPATDLTLNDFAERMREAGGKSRLLTKEEFGNKLNGRPSDEEISEYEKITASDTPIDEDNVKKTEEEKAKKDKETEDEDVVYYTYVPGDTFGEVINKLGLRTKAGLWGKGGDVEYYTQQLYDQGALDQRGNVPIGTTIKLRRRK